MKKDKLVQEAKIIIENRKCSRVGSWQSTIGSWRLVVGKKAVVVSETPFFDFEKIITF